MKGGTPFRIGGLWEEYAAPATLGHDQRLLVPKTEEKRCAPWLDLGDAPDGGALRDGGAGRGAVGAGRS
jgi:hypothetical protein